MKKFTMDCEANDTLVDQLILSEMARIVALHDGTYSKFDEEIVLAAKIISGYYTKPGRAK